MKACTEDNDAFLGFLSLLCWVSAHRSLTDIPMELPHAPNEGHVLCFPVYCEIIIYCRHSPRWSSWFFCPCLSAVCMSLQLAESFLQKSSNSLMGPTGSLLCLNATESLGSECIYASDAERRHRNARRNVTAGATAVSHNVIKRSWHLQLFAVVLINDAWSHLGWP